MAKDAYQEKFGKVMDEFKRGVLRDSSGKLVTDKKQAFAIAISEAKKAKAGGKFKKIVDSKTEENK